MSFIFLRNRVTGGAAFSPASLFSSGEEGAWYEPSTTTCFTDTAGTTAASVGDAVARINDLSGNGNHATQATAAARPILARVPSGGRRNLLTYSEDFQNAVWINDNSTFSFTTGQSDPFSGSGATLLEIINTASNEKRIRQTVTHTANQTFSVYLKNDDQRYAQLRVAQSSSNWAAAAFDLQTGEPGTTAEKLAGNYVSSSITPVGGGWHRCTLTVGFAATSLFCIEMVSSASPTRSVFGSEPITGTLGAGFYVIGAQWENASSATAYQKVTSQYDITEAGVTSLEYLAFDGSDDFLVTPATVDLSTSDKLTVISGAEKESDALSIIADNGNSVIGSGTFYHGVGTVVGGGQSWWASSRGTATGKVDQAAESTATFAAPITSVVTAQHDIPGDLTSLRVDGAANGTDGVGDKGAGNFANYNFWIGARAYGGGSLFFDGKLFSLIVRGAASTAQEISDTESYVANLSGVEARTEVTWDSAADTYTQGEIGL